MYYSIYDIQTRRYLYTGMNSSTKKECVECGLEFLTNDWGDEDLAIVKKVKGVGKRAELLEGFELEIIKHKKEMDDE